MTICFQLIYSNNGKHLYCRGPNDKSLQRLDSSGRSLQIYNTQDNIRDIYCFDVDPMESYAVIGMFNQSQKKCTINTSASTATRGKGKQFMLAH